MDFLRNTKFEYVSLYRRFNREAVGSLINEDFKECPNGILDLCGYSRDSISISNKTDLAVLLMQNNTNIYFDSVSSYFNFTKDQLNNLSTKLPKLWKDERFLFLYMEKLFPTQFSFYLSRYDEMEMIQEFVPKQLAMSCYDILLQFAMKDERAKLSPIRKANILLNYMEFRLKFYVCHLL